MFHVKHFRPWAEKRASYKTGVLQEAQMPLFLRLINVDQNSLFIAGVGGD